MSAVHRESPSTKITLLLRVGISDDEKARNIAWGEFYKAYAPVIAGFARRMGARQDEIDDVVQEVMAGFFRTSSKFRYDRSKGRFRWYLMRFARNKLVDLIEKRLPTLEPAQMMHLVAEPEIEAAWEQAWQEARLNQAKEIVRERYSRRADQHKTFAAFEHCEILGRATADVAKDLNMTIEQVHKANSRIREALRETIQAMDELAG